MSLLDVFTGGKSDEATDALKRAEAYFSNIAEPTVQQLTLPQLQQYVEAGVLTPAEAQAYLQTSNAYNEQNIPQTGTAAQINALNKLAEVGNAGAEGTPAEKAMIENAIQQMNTAVGGQRGAIEQAMAARGTPYALIQAALANQTAGQEGQTAHMNAVNAAGNAYQNALNALAQSGNVGQNLQAQQNAQANQIAQAQNAMQQFNAANQQQNSQYNAANRMAANTYNAQNKQNIANQNTGLANTRTTYNAQLPQQVFQNQMSKAQGMAGAAQNIGNLYNQQGQQNAGIWSGLINLGASFIPKAGGAAPMQSPVDTGRYYGPGYAHGGYVDNYANKGGYCMDDGGMVPGEADVAGDSLMNDHVPIKASPGEAVIPRSSVAEHPDEVNMLLGNQESGPQIDFNDVATLLKALRSIRMGVA